VAKQVPIAPGWRRVPGSARNYENIKTGEVLSRRQYEKQFGSLARRGVTSFEQGAKLTPEEVRKSRPARGRASPSISIKSISRARPTLDKHARTFRDGDQPESYDEMLAALRRNKGIQAILAGARYVLPDGKVYQKWFPNIVGQVIMSLPDDIIDGETAYEIVINEDIEDVDGGSSKFDYFDAFIFHTRFLESFTKKKPAVVKKRVGYVPPKPRKKSKNKKRSAK
jgi:hypothetical protein